MLFLRLNFLGGCLGNLPSPYLRKFPKTNNRFLPLPLAVDQLLENKVFKKADQRKEKLYKCPGTRNNLFWLQNCGCYLTSVFYLYVHVGNIQHYH